MPELAVNIDHVATIREARKTFEPDPLWAASIVEQAGADGLVMHIRQDRRHIQERDVQLVSELIRIPINIEMAATEANLALALKYRPRTVTLVPESAEEVTTEGGMNLLEKKSYYSRFVHALRERIEDVSVFIDADPAQIQAATEISATSVELHTGVYAERFGKADVIQEIKSLSEMASQARSAGLKVRAGHGLTYLNVSKIAAISDISELSIGHSIIARAVFTGLQQAVKDMIMLTKYMRAS